MASLCLNGAVLTTMIIAFEVSSARRSSERLLASIQDELTQYRMILVVPGPLPVPPPVRPKSPPAMRSPLAKPLAVPDPRLLQHLDPELAGFVKENPEIENIITRELVRDVDNRVLDVERLVRRSEIRLSFETDEEGHISNPRIDKSSQVPSIDHLAVALVRLLDKYELLGLAAGVKRIVVSINVDQQIEISLEGEVSNPADLEEVRRQVQNEITLTRFALAKTDAAFLLKDLSVTVAGSRLVLSRSFEKEPLINFLLLHCGGGSQK